MRVTDLTKQHAVVRNMNNNAERLQNLQESLASGRRINRLSDDPMGATRSQDYRTELSYAENIVRNIESNYVWLDRSEAELAHAADLVKDAKTLALAQANDSADDSTRRLSAKEMEGIIDGALQSANAKLGKLFLFSGTMTLTRPMELNGISQKARVELAQTDNEESGPQNPEAFKADFDGFSSHPYVVKITRPGALGEARFVVSDDGGKTWGREKTLLQKVEVVNDEGAPSDKVYLKFDAGQTGPDGKPLAYPTGMTLSFTPNPPVAYRGNDEKRMVPAGDGSLLPLNVTGREAFFPNPKIADSLDVFGVLNTVKRAMEENDQRVIQDRLGDLDRAHDQLLMARANLGETRREMESHLNKMEDHKVTTTHQLSEVEDLNVPEAVVEMNTADVRHKAALDTSGRLIQPSLLQFLR
ncbi:MAG: hypothetical protein OEV94_04000 [Deltaproteobacteria bacterium]|nr:hypothetical protein [Deltaproteobacteria bacterium]